MNSHNPDQVSLDDITHVSLRGFYAFWRSRAESGRVPDRDRFPVEDLGPWLGNIQIVEVVDGGRDFRHRLIGTRIVEAVGRDLTGRLVSECEYRTGTEVMLRRYRESLERDGPTFRRGRVFWARNMSWLRFESITVPMTVGGEAVAQLWTVIAYINDSGTARDHPD